MGVDTVVASPLGEVNVRSTTPELVAPSNLKAMLTKEASEVLGTGDPPSRFTFRPWVEVEAVMVVPAAMGLSLTGLASATNRGSKPASPPPAYQGCPPPAAKPVPYTHSTLPTNREGYNDGVPVVSKKTIDID